MEELGSTWGASRTLKGLRAAASGCAGSSAAGGEGPVQWLPVLWDDRWRSSCGLHSVCMLFVCAGCGAVGNKA
jgi:hypothetical protein